MNRLGLDIGKARIGIATSYSLLATNCKTINCVSWTKDTDYIAKFAKDFAAEEIIVGMPLYLDGTLSKMCDYVNGFCQMLSTKVTSKIIFMDERLTSVFAEEIMHNSFVKTSKKKGLIDQISATIILQSYLDQNKKE